MTSHLVRPIHVPTALIDLCKWLGYLFGFCPSRHVSWRPDSHNGLEYEWGKKQAGESFMFISSYVCGEGIGSIYQHMGLFVGSIYSTNIIPSLTTGPI